MFADLTGFTAMMQDNEQAAWDRRNNFKSVLDELVIKHHGQVIQYYGDGSLSLFNSGVDAVKSATAIQLKLIELNIAVRIGLHSGDVVYDEHGAYGDGVNVASRIETLAAPGSVLFSEKIFER